MMRLQLIEQFLPCRVQRPIGTGQFFQEVAFRSRGKSRPRFAFVEAAFGAYLAPQFTRRAIALGNQPFKRRAPGLAHNFQGLQGQVQPVLRVKLLEFQHRLHHGTAAAAKLSPAAAKLPIEAMLACFAELPAMVAMVSNDCCCS